MGVRGVSRQGGWKPKERQHRSVYRGWWRCCRCRRAQCKDHVTDATFRLSTKPRSEQTKEGSAAPQTSQKTTGVTGSCQMF